MVTDSNIAIIYGCLAVSVLYMYVSWSLFSSLDSTFHLIKLISLLYNYSYVLTMSLLIIALKTFIMGLKAHKKPQDYATSNSNMTAPLIISHGSRDGYIRQIILAM